MLQVVTRPSEESNIPLVISSFLICERATAGRDQGKGKECRISSNAEIGTAAWDDNWCIFKRRKCKPQSRNTALWVGGRGMQTVKAQGSQVVRHVNPNGCESSCFARSDVFGKVIIKFKKALSLAATVRTPGNLSTVRDTPQILGWLNCG